ncbi:hypothetical protein BYT27DRAFT_6952107 [Phlegmacium glaucopus]|nr:hypothetical protein BYT27DRAFT_6952107 [Phlegmacium glaucopus]
MLQSVRVAPTGLSSMIHGELNTYRTSLLSTTNHNSLQELLSLLYSDRKESEIVKKWMDPLAIQYVCSAVEREVEAAKPQLHLNTNSITPEYMSTWNVNKIWILMLRTLLQYVLRFVMPQLNLRNCQIQQIWILVIAELYDSMKFSL